MAGSARPLTNREGALLIPQRAVTELQGAYQVAVVDERDKIDVRNVKTGDRVGSSVDHRRRIETGRTRGCGGRPEGSSRHDGEPETVRRPAAEAAGK